MSVFSYFLVLNLAFAACNGLLGSLGPSLFGLTPILKPFEFEKWSEFVKMSKKSSELLLKNPISYSGKLATKMTISLEPLTMTKVDLDKNV